MQLYFIYYGFAVFLNHTIPITATVIAAKAAAGLMLCNVAKVAVKRAKNAMNETKITNVPMAMFLLLKFLTLSLFDAC